MLALNGSINGVMQQILVDDFEIFLDLVPTTRTPTTTNPSKAPLPQDCWTRGPGRIRSPSVRPASGLKSMTSLTYFFKSHGDLCCLDCLDCLDSSCCEIDFSKLDLRRLDANPVAFPEFNPLQLALARRPYFVAWIS